ncbi:unnamed protein product [Symbiodinium sp. KB8]|nr:unnamed protein product [Symbiodinium sp. KB8]
MAHFPTTLALGDRVLKQNRGSKGEGIWWVSLDYSQRNAITRGGAPSDDTLVYVTEAKDNHVEVLTLREFMAFCEQYLEGDTGFIMNQRFLPRIREGELRLLMTGTRVLHVVDRRPAANHSDSFSANLGAGSVHRYYPPSAWPGVVGYWQQYMGSVLDRVGVSTPPVLWTADFIRAGPPAKTRYILSEINASCVGFSSFPEVAQSIAAEVVECAAGTLQRIANGDFSP